jgi:hypothetical protein
LLGLLLPTIVGDGFRKNNHRNRAIEDAQEKKWDKRRDANLWAEDMPFWTIVMYIVNNLFATGR